MHYINCRHELLTVNNYIVCSNSWLSFHAIVQPGTGAWNARHDLDLEHDPPLIMIVIYIELVGRAHLLL
jgi:hypothetical protein